MSTRPHLSAHLAAGALVALLLAAPAQANIGDPSVKCTDSAAADVSLNPSYVDCSAHYDDVPAPETTLIEPFAGHGNFNFIGQTKNDDTGSGPFGAFGSGFKFGDLVLDAPQKGQFVIALASFNDYSLYLYDAGTGAVTSIFFDTFGTSNNFGGPYQLEYANLYAAVPEPATLALMLAGLGALALRRRRV